MNDDMDIEKMLKQYKSDPGPRVKQSVMNRFVGVHRNRFAGAHGGEALSGEGRLWKRPVPLYIFAAGVILAIGLSFFAGRMTSLSQQRRTTSMEALPAAHEDSLQNIEWQVAPNDLL
jgi:hypothetical protein